MPNNALRVLILIVVSLYPGYSFSKNTENAANRSPVFDSLAKQLEENYLLSPEQRGLSAAFDNEIKKYNFVMVMLVENGVSFNAPALLFDKSGLLLLPNIMLAKDQKVIIMKGTESEAIGAFHISRNNFTILRSKLYEGVKPSNFSNATILQGQEVVSVDLLCELQCQKTAGIILLKMGSEKIYANIQLNYPSKRNFMGPIFNKNGDLLGFNTLKMDGMKIDKKYDRDIYFLIPTSELLASIKEELTSLQKLN